MGTRRAALHLDLFEQPGRRGVFQHPAEAMKNTSLARFAICLKNKACEDLVVRKVYPILPDERAEKGKYLRVIDESGEDYLYPASYFIVIALPQKAERALRQKLSIAA
jgi:hypothetical protein